MRYGTLYHLYRSVFATALTSALLVFAIPAEGSITILFGGTSQPSNLSFSDPRLSLGPSALVQGLAPGNFIVNFSSGVGDPPLEVDPTARVVRAVGMPALFVDVRLADPSAAFTAATFSMPYTAFGPRDEHGFLGSNLVVR